MTEKIRNGSKSKTLEKIRARSSSNHKMVAKNGVVRLHENVHHIEISGQKFSVDAIVEYLTPLNRVKATQFPSPREINQDSIVVLP